MSISTVQRLIERAKPTIPEFEVGDTVIIMDTFYFRRGFGIMAFRDEYTKKNLFWKFLKNETNAEYKSGIDYLQSNGWNVLGIVCDGRKGLFTLFKGIPVQMCHFHQSAIIKRYITLHPKLEGGKELQKIAFALGSVQKEEFISMLEKWHKKWGDFIKEKTLNEETGRRFYTHRRLRSAYFSLKRNTSNLFTYLEYPELKYQIPLIL